MEILDLTSGEFFFLSDGEPIRPAGSRFGIYYPPFTIIKSCVKEMKGSVAGVGAVGKPPAGLPTCPSIFETGFQRGAYERRAGGRNNPRGERHSTDRIQLKTLSALDQGEKDHRRKLPDISFDSADRRTARRLARAHYPGLQARLRDEPERVSSSTPGRRGHPQAYIG